jgi:uncharacterized protein
MNRLWVDADACPREVREVILRAAARTNITTVLVANKVIPSGPNPMVTHVLVSGGADVADDHIVVHAVAGDIAITADIPLAARLVPNRVVVIDHRGEVLDAENIGERLSVRDFMTEARDVGMATHGPKAYSPRDKQRFASALDATLQRVKQANAKKS